MAGLCGGAHADTTWGLGTAGVGLAARATFSLVGNQLKVVVTNVGADPTRNLDALGALFFTLPTGVVLTRVSAAMAAGSDAYGHAPPVSNIGYEWACKGG